MQLKTSFFKPFKFLLLSYLTVNALLRIVLVFHPITTTSFTVKSIFKLFLLGALNDFLVFTIGFFFFWIYYIFLSDGKYRKPIGNIIFICLLFLLAYISFFNTILNEYGGVVPEIALYFLSIKTILFGLCLLLPQYRNKIRKGVYFVTLFLFVLIIVQSSVSEFFFWNEFGVRYNFIAVDYLVYTNTVIGNIIESYPVIPLFIMVGLVTFGITFWIYQKTKGSLTQLVNIKTKLSYSLIYFVVAAIALFSLPKLNQLEDENNVFATELQANGVYKFYVAFTNSELDYFKFYNTLTDEQLAKNLSTFYPSYQGAKTLSRKIIADTTEIKKNVVLITVESLSADFMAYYGNTTAITPFLDSLAQHSLFFTQTYATGNRTVRGLEAITLCIPPSPGESVVKRVDNKNKVTTASVFLEKGYQVKYLYGGDAYFDNMKDFFSGNGYDIVDKSNFNDEAITFDNIWGVCDEDMYRKAIEVMNEEAQQNKPFFNHIMTVSNHRPFTYPEGKIDISGQAKSRDGGVKYTDYSIKKFFEMAQKQAWFSNTVFVIVADHCASSAGKTELPLDKYRIPALIYAPGFVAPQEYQTLMSQIDVMPTLFGLLNFEYTSSFYGTNVLDSNYVPRAFIATYQDLGFIKDNTLTILSANQKVRQYTYEQANLREPKTTLTPVAAPNQKRVEEATSFYQMTAKQLKDKTYNIK